MSPLDPGEQVADVLRERYGLDALRWGGRAGGLSAENHHLDAGARPLFLKLYRRASPRDVQRIEQITFFLRDRGLPVVPPLPTVDGEHHVAAGDRILALYPRASGQALHEGTLSPAALRSTAALLARLHDCGAGCALDLGGPRPPPSLEEITRRAEHTRARIRQAPLDPEIDRLALGLVAAKLSLAERLSQDGPGGLDDPGGLHPSAPALVHGDFHNENLLYTAGGEVACLFDFDETHLGHPMSDAFHFVFLACCNTGYGAGNIDKARVFLAAYGAARGPLRRADVARGVRGELLQLVGAFFLEDALYERRELALVAYLERDRRKVDEHLRSPGLLVDALAP